MAWTAKNSLNPPKAADRLVNETGILLRTGACVLYRVVLTCLIVDSTDGGGTILITVPFQKAGDTVELRFRRGLNFATGLGIDLTAGTGTDGVVMITKFFAQTKQA